MGVNMAGYYIIDDDAVKEAARQEIVRRYFKTWCFYREGSIGTGAVEKMEMLMKQLGIKPEDGSAVNSALEKSKQNECPAMALILNDGSIMTGKTTNVLTAASSLVLNCVKKLAGIPDDIHLISPAVLEPMMMLKEKILRDKNPLLSLEEVLNALSICAATNPLAEKSLLKLHDLQGCVAHSSHMISKADENALKKLGVNITCTPEFPSDDLYYV
jgi:uncharacterized protein (UPF0371 family)